MKNLRLSKVSGPGGSTRADLEPPEQIQKVEIGHVASSGPWIVDIYRFLRWLRDRNRTQPSLVWFLEKLGSIFEILEIYLPSPLDLSV